MEARNVSPLSRPRVTKPPDRLIVPPLLEAVPLPELGPR